VNIVASKTTNRSGSRRFLAVSGLLITAALAGIISSCASPSQAATAPSGSTQVSVANPSAPVDPTSLTPRIDGETVSIQLSDVQEKHNTRFALTTSQGQASYMAYFWNGTLSVRADICPPCGSRSFKLTKGTLVCNSCGTVFDAVSGKGKSGACVRYAKQSVPFQISGGSILMKMSDLTQAYQKTLSPD
jgi:uncharacterized membrane protein